MIQPFSSSECGGGGGAAVVVGCSFIGGCDGGGGAALCWTGAARIGCIFSTTGAGAFFSGACSRHPYLLT